MMNRRILLGAAGCGLVAGPALAFNIEATKGRILERFIIEGMNLPPRMVQVWVPAGYDPAGPALPVIYMHDGQNLLTADPRPMGPFGRWGVDLALDSLINAGQVGPAIIVAIDNSPNRAGEYMPQTAFALAEARGLNLASSSGLAITGQTVASDTYLRLITEMIKPRIDRDYRTDPHPHATSLMGSSMGGLISLYGLCRHANVFGRAACLSTHWVVGDGIVLDYMKDHLPDPATHRIYFDRGTEELDGRYAPYQPVADRIARDAGYRDGLSLDTSVFPGATHNEASWARRVDVPLRFLLKP